MTHNKRLTQKEFQRILLQITPKIVSKGEPVFSLGELVWSLESYPFFKYMYGARRRVIQAILVLEYSGKINSIYGDVDRFFAEHALDNVNDSKWRGIIARVSLNAYEFEQIFSERSSTRDSTKPMRYIYLHVLWGDVNAKYVVSDKVRRAFAAWFDSLCTSVGSAFFNKIPSGEHFQKNRKMFMDAFEERFPLPLNGEPRLFKHKERQQKAEAANFRCQWQNADGQICNKELPLEKGEVDHIKPYSRGGKTILENARWICPPRNKGKGTKCIYDNVVP